MRGRSFLISLVFLGGVLSSAGTAAAGSHGSQPGSALPESLEGSRVYWSQFVDLDFSASRIVAANPHGRHFRVLTHPAARVHDIDPQVSPDGTKVLFARELPNDSGEKIGLVDANGGPVRIIKPSCRPPCLSNSAPTWGPDGRHIVYNKNFGPIVNDNLAAVIMYESDLWGRHPVRLSPPGVEGVFEDNHPTFAPGGYIVFFRYSIARDKSAAFRMDADRSNVRRLTPWSLGADLLSVSPARTGPSEDLVVFETYGHGPPDGVAQAIATVSATSRCGDGCASHIRYFTSPGSLPVQNFNPTWSPDGKEIAYVKFSYVETDTPPVQGDIWRMRWDGEGKAPVSRSPILFDFQPAWGW